LNEHNKRRWKENTIFVIILQILFFPIKISLLKNNNPRELTARQRSQPKKRAGFLRPPAFD
jgi:hypothetical protein